ncbi:dienelactone hydrolase family protein [Microbacterium sp. LRZ72]|uniref:alpha/beta hydrolase family protein n=1 Tax=Microbacterium sp. LRZ72 TaxID=2942481 RepID=UPI0029A22914|nr:alpha/beta family hydrolase [Microbacterium sp. LRZ72]MDX2375748.1 dienelactone hydrolase family protein [Microbacterium sp. LRZ72]
MTIRVALATGETEVSAVYEAESGAWAALGLAHGAGSGMEHPFLLGLCAQLNARGIATLRFQFPYREAGRRMPGPPTAATATWSAVGAALRERVGPQTPVWAAGRSYGGRMASMAVAEGVLDVAGLVYLGYPLHAPGRPERPRAAHLHTIDVPQLFLSGTADPFVQPVAQLQDVVASCPDATLHWVDGARHGFEVRGEKRSPAEIGAALAPTIAEFVRSRGEDRRAQR